MDDREDRTTTPPLGEVGANHRAVSDGASAGYAIAVHECAVSSARAPFRTHVRRQDVDAIEDLTRRAGVFNDEEVDVARELAEETLAKGEEESGYYFLFADGEHGLDGYACVGLIPGTNRRCELYWIAVDPAARRRGLGRRLQHAAEDLARDLDAVYLIAETSTHPAYAAARGFYLSRGYELIAEVPDWHDDGDGLAIFRKRLQRG
jgi:ribosomal protein S18 acetylase RimI-like enzyme